jgi:hypothetical protein
VLVPFTFWPKNARAEGTKKTATTALIAAREKPIWLNSRQVNKVRRIGAFPCVQTKKLPWDEAIAAELAMCLPVKAEARKEDRSLALNTGVTNGCCGGVTRPSGSLADWRPGYTSLSATVFANYSGFPNSSKKPKLPTTGGANKKVQMVGATTDPRNGCSVNTTESASRLIRLHEADCQWSGLNGWGTCAFSTR